MDYYTREHLKLKGQDMKKIPERIHALAVHDPLISAMVRMYQGQHLGYEEFICMTIEAMHERYLRQIKNTEELLRRKVTPLVMVNGRSGDLIEGEIE